MKLYDVIVTVVPPLGEPGEQRFLAPFQMNEGRMKEHWKEKVIKKFCSSKNVKTLDSDSWKRWTPTRENVGLT